MISLFSCLFWLLPTLVSRKALFLSYPYNIIKFVPFKGLDVFIKVMLPSDVFNFVTIRGPDFYVIAVLAYY